MNALFEQAHQKLLETQDPELESLCDAMAEYIPTTAETEAKTETETEPEFKPNGEIDLDYSLYPAGMDWGFDKPDVPHTTVYIFNNEEDEEKDKTETEGQAFGDLFKNLVNNTKPLLACVVCDKAIVRDSAEHDQSILVNRGDDIICPDCPRKCKAECGECVVCDSDWSDDDVTDADREEARWEALWEEE